MRIPSRATWLQLAILTGAMADKVADDTLDTDFFFTWSQFPHPCEIHQGASIISSSIVAYNNSVTFQLLFLWTNTSSFTFQNAILVDSTSGNKTVARGYLSNSNEPKLEDDSVPQFPVSLQGSLTLDQSILTVLDTEDLGKILFFQIGWKDSTGSDRYGTSPPWAIAEDVGAANELYNSMLASSITLAAVSTATAMYAAGTSPPVDVPVPVTTSAATGTSTPTTTTSSAAALKSGHHLALSVGAIVGIVIGGLAVLVLASLLIGCACIRRRRRGNTPVEGESSREVQTMQDLMADKERRAGFTENTTDTPCSEGDSQIGLQRPLARGLGMSGLNGSGIDMSTGAGTGSIHSGSHFSDTRRGSAAYSSLRGITAVGTAVTTASGAGAGAGDSPTHTHPSSTISLHERSSMMDSPAHRVSSQQDRAFSPYRDQPTTTTTTGGADPDPDPDPDSDPTTASDTVSNPNKPGDEHPAAAPSLPPPASIHDHAASNSGGGGSRAGTPQLGPARYVRSATPGGVSISEQYAHLVEEGMSDDEIRRLEEEERVLDEAIEQARTDSRAR